MALAALLLLSTTASAQGCFGGFAGQQQDSLRFRFQRGGLRPQVLEFDFNRSNFGQPQFYQPPYQPIQPFYGGPQFGGQFAYSPQQFGGYNGGGFYDASGRY
jgi:hypothetical protein